MHERPLLAATVALAAIASPVVALADVGPPSMREAGTYVSAGATAALSVGAGTGGVIGGEVSIVGLNLFEESSGVWLGGYVDGVYDSRTSGGRFSIGPEVGWAFFGVDGGYVLSLSDAGAQHGLAVRGLLTFAFVALYARVGVLFGDEGEAWGEIGLLLKYPISITGPGIGIE